MSETLDTSWRAVTDLSGKTVVVTGVILSRKYFVLLSNLSRRAVVSFSISNTASDAPTIAGIKVLLNKYGRER